MKAFFKILFAVSAFIVLHACGPGTEQKMITAKADSLFIRVRCVKTVSELIENTVLVPAQKKLQYKIDYINETYPDTITRSQAEKLVMIKNSYMGYNSLILTAKALQKQSAAQLLQVSKLNHEISKGREENMVQYLTFESKCADTLNTVLDALVKRSIELGCKMQSLN